MTTNRDAPGSPFCLGAGQRKTISSRGGAGPGENARGGGGEQLNPGAFSGWGILENFGVKGALGQPFRPGSGQGGAGRASLTTTPPENDGLL